MSGYILYLGIETVFSQYNLMDEAQISQNQIVQLLADGKRWNDIAEIIGCEPRQIEWKIKTMKERFFCKTQCQLVAEFLRRKLIE